jgi:lysine-N-methylase
MTRFQCLGGACEDTCCAGWRVLVDQGHHARLRRVLPAETARHLPLLPPAERTREHFAVIQFPEDGPCPFLSPDRLCTIHAQHGEDLLPDTCATYPRTVSRVGDRLELTGALSCPEVARLLLLAEDGAELVEIDPALCGRGQTNQDLTTAHVPDWARHLDELRGTMYQLVLREEYPLESRLFFMAALAERTDGLFQGAAGGFDQAALEAEIDRLCQDRVLAGLHQELRQYPARPAALELVAETLGLRLRRPTLAAFRDLVDQVLSSYAAEPGAGVALAGGELSLHSERLLPAYQRRRARLGGMAARITRYFANYCKHFWIREWYAFSQQSLRLHVLSLLLRIAVLRFLLLSHPEAAAGDPAGLDRLAVRVFYSLSRTTEHSREYLAEMLGLLEKRLRGMPDVAALIAL